MVAISLASASSNARDDEELVRQLKIGVAFSGLVAAGSVVGIIASTIKVRFNSEQFCPEDSQLAGAFCCNPPQANPVVSPPNASNTAVPTSALTVPVDCVFQAVNFGNCDGGKVLYCPGSAWPAPIRPQTWTYGLMVASAVILSASGITLIVLGSIIGNLEH
jgi:hypothetical protein